MRRERHVRAPLVSTQTSVLKLITARRLDARDPSAADLIVGDARASAAARLDVYRHMYVARLAEALEAQFPRLARLVGDDFHELAAAFVDDEPSIRPSLRELGRPLAAWLAEHRRDEPELAALARLEWARADVFDLEDDPQLTLDDLRAWPAETFGELPLALVTAHRLVVVSSGAAALWDAIGAGGADVLAIVSDVPERLVVWREDVAVYHRVIDADEHGALALVEAGASFGAICERLSVGLAPDDAVARAFAWLSTWVSDGLIAAPRVRARRGG
ncbi:MAG TPA: DNA-binding domain-containing protein [Polyangia bacterium]|nr:DNA-binding domain-containing protein [Polyangia bacterium]